MRTAIIKQSRALFSQPRKKIINNIVANAAEKESAEAFLRKLTVDQAQGLKI